MTAPFELRNVGFENIHHSSNNVLKVVKGMQIIVAEWKLNKVSFWHSFSCLEEL